MLYCRHNKSYFRIYFILCHMCWKNPCGFKDRPAWLVLMFIAIIFNICIKLHVWWKSHKYHSMTQDKNINDESSNGQLSMEYFATAAFVSVLMSSVAMTFLFANGDAMVVRLTVFGHQSLTLPVLFFIMKPKMRAFFMVQFKRIVDTDRFSDHWIFTPRHSEVHPTSPQV